MRKEERSKGQPVPPLFQKPAALQLRGSPQHAGNIATKVSISGLLAIAFSADSLRSGVWYTRDQSEFRGASDHSEVRTV